MHSSRRPATAPEVYTDKEAMASAHEKEDAIPSEEGGCGLCQKLVFIDSGNDKKALLLMSIGVSADNKNEEPLFLFERITWSLLPETAGMHPCNKDYVKEIVRQAEIFHVVPVPRPSNWMRVQTMERLYQNPVQDKMDIQFLRSKVLRLHS